MLPPHPTPPSSLLSSPNDNKDTQKQMYKMHQSKRMLYSVLALWCTLKKQDKTRPDTAAIRHLLTPRLSLSFSDLKRLTDVQEKDHTQPSLTLT